MLVRRTDPFRDLTVLRKQMDDLFNRSLTGLTNGEEGESMSNWVPAMDVLETEDKVVLRAELPGMTQEDVHLTVENNVLTLSGEKNFSHEESEGHYRRIESRYGSFYRSFTLPSTVDQEKIDANFRNGVLEIVLPKAEKAKPKKIEVKVN
jgi:HSP20 family protein